MYYNEDAYREVFPPEPVTVKPPVLNNPDSMLPDDDPEPATPKAKEDELNVPAPEPTPEEDKNEPGTDNSTG